MTIQEFETIVASARDAFAAAVTPAELENAKAQFVGKAGRITELMKGLGALSVDEKKSRGAARPFISSVMRPALPTNCRRS
jgi:phenylalanyl-tRNA synthetase alpha chain